MNDIQRVWLVGSLVVIGLVLAVTAFEWRSDGGIGFTFYTVPPPPIEHPRTASGRFDIPFGPTQKEYGIYVRRRWGPAAVAWGGFVPICLFAVAGFVALGRKPMGRRE
jgi:hypothetical protein